MAFALMALVTLVPLLLAPGILYYFDITPKVAVFYVCVGALMVITGWANGGIRAFLHLRQGRTLALLLSFEAAWLGVSTALSTHRELSIFGGTWRCFGLVTQLGLIAFILIAAAWLSGSERNRGRLLRAVMVVGSVISLYGIAQYFGFDPLLTASGYQAGEGEFTIVRPPGTLGHANYLGAWLAIVLFFDVAMLRLESDRRWRWLAGAAASLAGVAIVLSGTRAAMVAVIAGFVCLWVVERGRISLRAVVVGALVVAFLGGLFLSPAGLKLRARVHWSRDDVWGGARILLWRDSLAMTAVHPFAGFGLETFGTEFPRYESIALASAYPDFYHESPHNALLDIATSEGIPAALGWLAICAVAIAAQWRRKVETRGPLLAAFAAAIVCHWFSVFTLPTAMYFCLLVALMTAELVAAVPSERRFAVVGVAAAAGFLYCAVRLAMADVSLQHAQSHMAAADISDAATAYRNAIWWRPEANADLDYSRQMSKVSSMAPVFRARVEARQQALESGIRATSVAEDRQNAWYNLAMLLASQGNAPGVEKALRNSIAWSPNWFKPRWALAQLLAKTNRLDEALEAAEAAVVRDGGKDPEVVATRDSLRQSARNR